MDAQESGSGAPAGDFARLYGRHHAAVYAAARRILGDPADAEEVTQDVFLSLWSRPQRYDAERASLRTYLTLLARSRALDAWRARQAGSRSLERLMHATLAAPRAEEDCHQQVERAERLRAVRAAMRELPVAQRETVALTYWGGLTTGEIARRCEIPPGTARSRLRLGRAKLGQQLQASEDGAPPQRPRARRRE